MMLVIVLLILALLFGGLGYDRFGYVGWSPLGAILLIVLLLWLAGFLS